MEIGIERDDLLESFEEAMARTLVKANPEWRGLKIKVNPDSGEVIAKIHGRDEKLDRVRLRSLLGESAEQAIGRQFRYLYRRKLVGEMSDLVGQIAVGVVDRHSDGLTFLDMGRAEGVILAADHIPGEKLAVGSLVSVAVLKAALHKGQVEILCSRASHIFLERLLEGEIPEIAAGVVRIRKVARLAGKRSKVAVDSTQPEVNPIGACLGVKGERLRAIRQELGGEQIELIAYSEDQATLVASALAPAKVDTGMIKLDKKSRVATVTVDPSSVTSVIGKNGENVALAARLAGWKIDVKPNSSTPMI